tara:strand:+ start:151 stop:996 length:846 start_codon:yes stop_codon:yes gene_type:complete
MKFSQKFGISQGRLVTNSQGLLQHFPQDNWQKEFKIASSIGLSFIELLAERKYNPTNPLWSEEGRNLIEYERVKNGLEIYSLCADFIIDISLLGKNSKTAISLMQDLVNVVKSLSCKIVVLPFLEKNNLTKSNMLEYIPIIRDFSEFFYETNTIIALETLLNAKDLKELIQKINRTNVKCVFDTGNRINFKESLYEEILVLNELITHIHIKDKDINDTNVILGTGLVNFNSVFSALKKINYNGNFNFETTRGNNPEQTAIYNLNLCNFFIKENSLNVQHAK